MCINIEWTDSEETVLRWNFPLFWKSEEISDAFEQTKSLLQSRPLVRPFSLVVNANGNLAPRNALDCFKKLLHELHPDNIIFINADALEQAIRFDRELEDYQDAVHTSSSMPEAMAMLQTLPTSPIQQVS